MILFLFFKKEKKYSNKDSLKSKEMRNEFHQKKKEMRNERFLLEQQARYLIYPKKKKEAARFGPVYTRCFLVHVDS